MSEEQFDRIEGRLDQLQTGQNDLGLRIDKLDGRIDKLDGRMDAFDGRMGKLDGRMDKLDGRVGSLDNRIVDLDRHMRVLHEDVITRIAAIPEYAGPTREEFAELKAMNARRLDVLETIVRQHDDDIQGLKKRRLR